MNVGQFKVCNICKNMCLKDPHGFHGECQKHHIEMYWDDYNKAENCTDFVTDFIGCCNQCQCIDCKIASQGMSVCSKQIPINTDDK